MRTNSSPIQVRALRFRVAAFEELIVLRNLKTDTEKANFLGITAAHYYRVAKGETRPGPSFVGAVLKALPGVSFEHLFEIVEVER